MNINPEVPATTPTFKPLPKLSFKLRAQGFLSQARTRGRVITTVVSILIFTGSIGIGTFLVQRIQRTTAQAGTATVSLSTNASNPQVGDTIVVAVAIDTKGQNITGADLKIGFDQNLLEAQSIQAGSFLPNVIEAGNINDGTASIVLGALTGSSGPQSKTGLGILAQIVFKARTNGAATITLNPTISTSTAESASNVSVTTKELNITIGNVAL